MDTERIRENRVEKRQRERRKGIFTAFEGPVYIFEDNSKTMKEVT